MAADNQNRLASFTAWKRGRCKLALHWVKWGGGGYSWFSTPKQAQVAVVILLIRRLLPFPGLNCVDKIPVENNKSSSGSYLLLPTAAISARPHISSGRGCFSLSHVVFLFLFSPHTPGLLFVCFLGIKSSLNPGKALRTRRQQFTLPLLRSSSP